MSAPRLISLLAVLLAIGSMLFAVGYLQMVEHLEPCPLCILDRVVVIALGVCFLLALLHHPAITGRRIYSVIAGLLALTGIGICARHIWLQNLPADQVPECGAGFWFMLDTMPIARFLDTILNGSGECADIQWTLFGFSLPELTLGIFVVFLLMAIALFFAKGQQEFHSR